MLRKTPGDFELTFHSIFDCLFFILLAFHKNPYTYMTIFQKS